MPVTPFHFGPGALVSVMSKRHCSFLSFCAVNVAIDIESLRNMITHQPRIHTFFHTYLGASIAARDFSSLRRFVPALGSTRKVNNTVHRFDMDVGRADRFVFDELGFYFGRDRRVLDGLIGAAAVSAA